MKAISFTETKMWHIKYLLLLSIAYACVAQQDNVQFRIPNALEECYRNVELNERDNRLPSNINILIELIRKIEDTPGANVDMRQVATTLVHRFRMDGIERATDANIQPGVLPFSPSGFQFSKHRILLSRLIPNNANAPITSLTSAERVRTFYINGSLTFDTLMHNNCFNI